MAQQRSKLLIFISLNSLILEVYFDAKIAYKVNIFVDTLLVSSPPKQPMGLRQNLHFDAAPSLL